MTVEKRIRRAILSTGFEQLPEDREADLRDYGMDSLMVVLAVAALEKEFSIRIPAACFTEDAFQSVAAIEAFLAKLEAR